MMEAFVDVGWQLKPYRRGHVQPLKLKERADGDAIFWSNKAHLEVCASYWKTQLKTSLKLPELADQGQNMWNVNSC